MRWGWRGGRGGWVGGGVGVPGGGYGGEVYDSCQCSRMSNMSMHDVRMLKVLVWTQYHYSAAAVKETPDRLAVCIVGRAITLRLHLNVVAELLGIIPGRLYFDRGIRETPGVSLCDRDRPEVKDSGRDLKVVVSSHGEPDAVPSLGIRRILCCLSWTTHPRTIMS